MEATLYRRRVADPEILAAGYLSTAAGYWYQWDVIEFDGQIFRGAMPALGIPNPCDIEEIGTVDDPGGDDDDRCLFLLDLIRSIKTKEDLPCVS